MTFLFLFHWDNKKSYLIYLKELQFDFGRQRTRRQRLLLLRCLLSSLAIWRTFCNAVATAAADVTPLPPLLCSDRIAATVHKVRPILLNSPFLWHPPLRSSTSLWQHTHKLKSSGTLLLRQFYLKPKQQPTTNSSSRSWHSSSSYFPLRAPEITL